MLKLKSRKLDDKIRSLQESFELNKPQIPSNLADPSLTVTESSADVVMDSGMIARSSDERQTSRYSLSKQLFLAKYYY
jgi:hypothetical protein